MVWVCPVFTNFREKRSEKRFVNKARGRAGAVTILSPAFTYRKYVVRPMPSFLQISETVRSGFAAIVLERVMNFSPYTIASSHGYSKTIPH